MMDNAKQTKKIILIEDHENLRMMMKHLLEDEGFNVIALECAEDFDDEPKTKDAGLGKRALRSERGIGYKLTSSLILN